MPQSSIPSDSMHFTPIGQIRSPYTDPLNCPTQAGTKDPVSRIELAPDYLPALRGLKVGQQLIILTWLHQADRTILQAHPQRDPQQPLHGVFATRSPNRPNPIGHHIVTLLGMENNILTVHPVEVLDKTPVLDIKPAVCPRKNHPSPAGSADGSACPQPDMVQTIIHAGRDGWQRGLFNGMNGNISLKAQQHILITGTGSAKGHLQPHNLTLMDRQTRHVLSGPAPSSETPVHLAIYANQPDAGAIIHTHPPHLLALFLSRAQAAEQPLEHLLNLPLFEAKVFTRQLISIPALTPGTEELAQAAGEASATHPCIFMGNHGLVVWAADLVQALALTEEMESLARICLKTHPS